MNTGAAVPTEHSDVGVTGIDKHPADRPLQMIAPGPRGTGGSGLAGDEVCDLRHHGGDDQAVYAFASEDYPHWEDELGRRLRPGIFGENLTTSGIDLNAAFLGDRWSIGSGGLTLQITTPRIPCRTFAGHLDERAWVKRFTQHGRPGTYLRVLAPGPAGAGDPISVSPGEQRITVGDLFRALTTQAELLDRLVGARDLPEKLAAKVAGRTTRQATRHAADDAG